MKKVIVIALCLVLALALCVPACAENTSYKPEDLVSELMDESPLNTYDIQGIKYNDEVMFLFLSLDGLANAADLAICVGSELPYLSEAWSWVADDMNEISSALQELADEKFNDFTVCVELLNDQHPDTLLYCSLSGECVYDYVSGFNAFEDDAAA